MNFLTLFTTIFPLILQAAPVVQQIWNSSAGGSLQKIHAALPPALVAQLAEVGAQLFPNLSPELHAAAAALVTAHPGAVSYVQDALNLIASTGYFVIPSGTLKVDGLFGPKTMGAIQAFEAKAGLPATNAITDVLNNALAALLAKM